MAANDKKNMDASLNGAEDTGPKSVRPGSEETLETQQIENVPADRTHGTLAAHMAKLHTNRSYYNVETEALALADVCLGEGEQNNDLERDYFRRGALLSWTNVSERPDYHQEPPFINPTEQYWLDMEDSKSLWDNLRISNYMFLNALLCGMSAIVQGMDQSAVNGAQVGYKEEYRITNEWEEGLINGAPYLCCVLIGCWTSFPFNKFLGRKWTIGISCACAIASGIWQMCVSSKWELFAARFFLGFAIGAKSSTTPAFSAECAPRKVRGFLGSMWQAWTAFGIMLGFIVDYAFLKVYTSAWGENSGWRIILGTTAAPAVVVCILIFFVPESPRWLIMHNNYPRAYKSLCKLRKCKLQAARDLYEIDCIYKHENMWKARNEKKGFSWKNTFRLFTIPRNRRGAQSAAHNLFMQQMCGVNVIAYYSTIIFTETGSSFKNALLFSLGAGIINWLGAIPGSLTIDKKGRRSLLLFTFPLMALCLFFTGSGFYASDLKVRQAVVATGIYAFMCIYSPGMGPVPFTYAAEAYPLEVRDIGMAFATAVCWGFNFILALTFPPMARAFGQSGAFYFYAAWNVWGFLYTYFFLPETRQLPLEALDERFNVRSRDFAKYNYYKLPWVKTPMPAELESVREIMTRDWSHTNNINAYDVESKNEAGVTSKLRNPFRRNKANGHEATSQATADDVTEEKSSGGLSPGSLQDKRADAILRSTRTNSSADAQNSARSAGHA